LRAILETDEIEVWFGIYNNVNFYSFLFGQVFREFQILIIAIRVAKVNRKFDAGEEYRFETAM
jgi:hypothetical protein